MIGGNPFGEEKTVVIPAQWNHGKWVPFYGGEMPNLKEGTLAEFTVPQASFTDPKELQRFNVEGVEVILSAGSTLWAAMSPNFGMGGPGKGIPDKVRMRPQDNLGTLNLVSFQIVEDLKLHLRGTKQAQLENCRCVLEGFPADLDVLSINQAYTRLSERFEPGRRSHTGNVFDKVFCLDGDTLIPLDELRARAFSKLEKRLFHESGELGLTP